MLWHDVAEASLYHSWVSITRSEADLPLGYGLTAEIEEVNEGTFRLSVYFEYCPPALLTPRRRYVGSYTVTPRGIAVMVWSSVRLLAYR